MTKVLVTGTSGFLGKHFLAALTSRGIAFQSLARDSTGSLSTLDAGILASEQSEDRVPQVLVHLAWGSLPNYSSLHHVEIEAPSHYAFIRSMVRAGLRRAVVVGTCYEYGMQYGPLHEDLPARPVTAYGVGKDVLRRMLEQLAKETDFELTWVRLFYLWGEGQGSGTLYSQLRTAVEQGQPEFPMSGGEQLRDYLPVAQAVSSIADLAMVGRGLGVVNVCSARPVSVRSLVESWISSNGWSIRPVLGRFAYPAHEPMAFWGDDAKLRSILDHAPR